jgi:mannose-1-phosphate guanylyltransferase/mannose-1-phosphate guanylyltransferase/mannose-6-phosphate isomerase
MASSSQIIPVILSGGTGSRLWPQSRELYPKQLLALTSDKTLIQESVLRVSGENFAAPLIVCNDDQRFLIAGQMRQIGAAPQAIIIEPVGRNTAPAVAVAALAVDPAAILLVAPADHLITDRPAFMAAIAKGLPAVATGKLVTFGMDPTFPETGYGYIKRGTGTGDAGVFTVAAFVEKPVREVAEAYVASHDYFWNSGIFLFQAGAFLAELAQHAPDVLTQAKAALEAATHDLDFLRLDRAAFSIAPSISIDYAVMEKTDKAVVVPARMGWTDIGSWAALWDVATKDAAGNAISGDTLLFDATDCYVDNTGPLTALVGVKDIVVVNTPDALLVVHKDKAQEVRKVAERLKAEQRPQLSQHRKVHRPWGWYDVVTRGPGFQVKHIHIVPGGRMSLQSHAQRAERVTVVQGTATIICDGLETVLGHEESLLIPANSKHRVANETALPLELVEIQTGAYLGEDDIVRYEDTYNRLKDV